MVSGFITHNYAILLNGSNKLLVTGGALCKMDDWWQIVTGNHQVADLVYSGYPWISSVCWWSAPGFGEYHTVANHLNILSHKPHVDICLRKNMNHWRIPNISKYKHKVNIYPPSNFHRLCQIDPDRRSDYICLVILMVKRFVEGTVDPVQNSYWLVVWNIFYLSIYIYILGIIIPTD